MAAQVLERAREFFVREEIPAELGWVTLLSPANRRKFREELYDAVQAHLGEDEISELLAAWRATAELDGAPEVLAEVQRPKPRRKPLSDFLNA